ncbi:MAG: hypothetical protein VW268_02790 [Rhodospirillaceae bacterium]
MAPEIKPEVKDENLRLVLSPGHDAWIISRLQLAREVSWLALAIAVLCFGWIAYQAVTFDPWASHADAGGSSSMTKTRTAPS